MTLSSDLAAIRARLHRPTFHIPADRSFDGESIRCDYCVLHGTVARLLARLEEMRVGLEKIQMYAGNVDAIGGCRLILAKAKVLGRPLDAPG